MRNRTYGGVRGRKTKVGRKLLRFPPTRLNKLYSSRLWRSMTHDSTDTTTDMISATGNPQR